jgi:hypothetical protein
LWWSVSTCHGNCDELKERWTSVIHNISTKHSWDNATLFTCYQHRQLSTTELMETKWLAPGSDAVIALKEVVFSPKCWKTCSWWRSFTILETWRSITPVMFKCCPKRHHFSYKGMIARLQLTTLDHNHFTGRKQLVANTGAIYKGDAEIHAMWSFPKDVATG